jgi:hypothetical protein
MKTGRSFHICYQEIDNLEKGSCKKKDHHWKINKMKKGHYLEYEMKFILLPKIWLG